MALSPEPTTHYTPLKPSPLTTPSDTANGGAKPMTADVRQANQLFLEETAETFIVTIPEGISETQKFIAQTPMGERLLVTCPVGSKGGQKLRIPAPPREEEETATKTFQIKAPENVRSGQILPVLVCGKTIPIKLPANVVPGQILHLKLPVEQVVENIELSYEDQSTSDGWYRTIRLSDLKFQWIYQASDDQIGGGDDAPSSFAIGQAAFCRKLTFLEGNDPRMRTGMMELVPAPEVCSESTLRHHHRTLVSYATGKLDCLLILSSK